MAKNRWVKEKEDSGLFDIKGLIDHVAAEELRAQAAASGSPEAAAIQAKHASAVSESHALDKYLLQAIDAWRARIKRIQRFLALRSISERGLVASLVLLAGVSSASSVLGGLHTNAQRVLLVVTTIWGVLAAALTAFDPFRRAKLYRARLSRMISLCEDFRRQLRTLEPTREQVVTIARFAEFSHDLLKPQQDDWGP